MASKIKIYVVDDNAGYTECLKQSLIALGYDVNRGICCGEEVIAEVGKLKPDLILVDITLGGSAYGIDAAEKIHVNFDIPVIYLAAYDDENNFQRVKQTDPCAYLLKPFYANQLYHTIEIALHKHTVEEYLKEKEHRYRSIFEATGGATVVVAEDSVISIVNEEFEKLSGYSKVELQNKKFWGEFFVGEDLKRMKVFQSMRRMNPDSTLRHYGTNFVNRSGKTKNICLSIKMIPGTRESVISMIDINEYKQAVEGSSKN